MAFVHYREYMRSKAWKDKRQRILKRDRHTCRLCGRKGSVVHHNTYKRLGNERLADLITLCPKCHTNFHKHRSTIDQTESSIKRSRASIRAKERKEKKRTRANRAEWLLSVLELAFVLMWENGTTKRN